MITNQRIQALQAKLEEKKLDAAVYATSASLQYLLDDTTFYWQRTMETGFYAFKDTPMYSTQMSYFHCKPDILLWVPASGKASVVATYNRASTIKNTPIDTVCHFVMLGDYLAEFVHGAKKVGIGLGCESALQNMLREIDESIETVPAEALVEELRMVKDEREIAAMRKVAAFTDQCMEAIEPMLRPGVTQWQVETRLNELAVENGCSDVPFPPTCSFTKTGDPRCMNFHGIPKDEPMTPGTAIAFDNGFVMNGYCSDFGRSFYSGKAPEKISGAYKALQEAQLEVLDKIKPGNTISFTFKSIYDTLAKYGYQEYLRNYGLGLMGHQIGIDVHEGPWLHDESKEVFIPGMIMCIEPKVWMPGEVFMRVEDMVLITEDGCESLTKFNRDLYELPVD